MANLFPKSVRKAVFDRCRELNQREELLLDMVAPKLQPKDMPYITVLQELDRQALS